MAEEQSKTLYPARCYWCDFTAFKVVELPLPSVGLMWLCKLCNVDGSRKRKKYGV